MPTMRLSLQPLSLLSRLRATYWFVPSLVTVAAVGLAFICVELDRRYENATSSLGWAYGGGPEGARALLSAVAGSTMTVVSVTFSVMVVALTVSSQHFGPRLLTSFMRDHVSQLVLGTFTGTFTYCLIVLRTVQGEGDGYSVFVPHLAVTVALALTLLSVSMLILYVHHIATSMQVSEITASVARDLERTVERLYPDIIGHSVDPPARQPPPVPTEAYTVPAPRSGYLQEVDSDGLLSLACAADTVVWLLVRPGDFLVEGAPIGALSPVPADAPGAARRMRDALVVGTDRTARQDADFAVQQLVEVALRALSPGVNEPFTALTCIDRLGQGLTRLTTRTIPSAIRSDEQGDIRVITEPRTFVELVASAFEPIARFSGKNPAIAERLFETLGALGRVARRAEDRAAIAEVAEFVWTEAAAPVEEGRHKQRLTRLYAAVRHSLQRDAAPPTG